MTGDAVHVASAADHNQSGHIQSKVVGEAPCFLGTTHKVEGKPRSGHRSRRYVRQVLPIAIAGIPGPSRAQRRPQLAGLQDRREILFPCVVPQNPAAVAVGRTLAHGDPTGAQLVGVVTLAHGHQESTLPTHFDQFNQNWKIAESCATCSAGRAKKRYLAGADPSRFADEIEGSR